MSILSRRGRDETARLRDQLQAALDTLETRESQHAAAVAAIVEYIATEIAAAPQCPHNTRPSCGRCQWRAGLSKALELTREATELS